MRFQRKHRRSTKQVALTVIGITVVLAAVFHLATFFKA